LSLWLHPLKICQILSLLFLGENTQDSDLAHFFGGWKNILRLSYMEKSGSKNVQSHILAHEKTVTNKLGF
jgi:hypothetical protein